MYVLTLKISYIFTHRLTQAKFPFISIRTHTSKKFIVSRSMLDGFLLCFFLLMLMKFCVFWICQARNLPWGIFLYPKPGGLNTVTPEIFQQMEDYFLYVDERERKISAEKWWMTTCAVCKLFVCLNDGLKKKFEKSLKKFKKFLWAAKRKKMLREFFVRKEAKR